MAEEIGPGSWIVTLAKEWESSKCAVCGDDKWENYPFCRSDSIRLQRIGLMRRLKPYGGHRFGVLKRMEMVEYYDLCRDYLIVSKKFPKAVENSQQ